MKRISCIDIGTNTALLLIADLDPQTGTILPVCHKQTIVRLGKNVDEEKQIGPEALHRLVSCMLDYRRISNEHASETIIAVGTSALRDAKNRDAIISAVAEAAAINITCISGHEEAELTFFGAIAGTNNVPDLFSVIDIGGGSTEISMGSPEKLTQSVSLDIGSVRLTERHFSELPPTPDEFLAAKETINATLASTILPFIAARENVFGVAGTLTTIAQVSQGLLSFDPEKVHNYPLSCAEVHQLLEKFKTSKLEEIINMGIPEGRADVITMGTLILHQFMRLLGIGEIRVSIQGLRFGLAQKELLRLQGNT
ncbi:MAG: Ppx/GppA family phosphatase [Chlorobiaceae bacterium]|jgi:exopolyphosphatase / guanosine-5'-triphosphate,3'-diphosphate pyrophosphatase|nr:Ppx/GppA family phosphatase [Chlorobiaceae bacterium]